MAAPKYRRPLVRALAALVAVASIAAACGDNLTGPSIEEAQFAPSLGVDLAASTRTASGLYYRDVAVGTGAVAARGDTAEVRYELYLVNGRQVDAGTFSFLLGKRGQGGAILGFDEGVTGMRVGGRRQLIIPPELAYGADGNQAIPPSAILVFNAELLSLK